MKKVIKFLSSMQFALLLLALLIIACVIGSTVTQGEAASYYQESYSALVADIIVTMGMDDIFHCWWFLGLTGLLCLNLLFCNLLRFKGIVKQMKNYTPDLVKNLPEDENAPVVKDAEKLFAGMGFKGPEEYETADGKKGLYSARNRFGVWGAWLTHLGILIIIIGFTLGQITAVKHTVYGVAGQTKQIEDTEYELTFEDFSVELRDDETVKQYLSTVTVTNTATGQSESGQTSVNHPLKLFGMKLYQNSTGWAADAEVYRDGEMIQSEIVCAGEYTTIEAYDGLYLVFRAFYPDYTTAGGKPATASSALNNPAYLYMLYYGDTVLGMNVLEQDEEISVDDITIKFANPRQYSLIQTKTDRFTGIAAVGGIVILAALFVAFYVRVEELWAVEDGDKWRVYGRSKKGGILFKEKLDEHIKGEDGNE